eukprot:scaffold31763_cov63-Phaeocystis_antarctica.AAC.4
MVSREVRAVRAGMARACTWSKQKSKEHAKMLWAQTLKERDVALGGAAARLPGVVARPGGGCMAAGHALVIWAALGELWVALAG